MNFNNLRIIFVLTARFPTEKAYGVTTEHSARALTKKNYTAIITTPFRDLSLKSEINIIEFNGNLAKKLLSKKVRKFVFFRYYLFTIIYAFSLKSRFNGLDVIFWTRDIVISFFLALITKNIIVLEIHHVARGHQHFLMSLLMKRRQVFFAPITEFLSDKISLKNNRYIVAPMAVNRNELINPNMLRTKNNTIIYVGTFESGGVKLDCSFINELAQLIYKGYPEWNFEIVGINRNQFENQIQKSASPNIRFFGYVPRIDVLERMKLAKIGLVSYDKNEYHQFPIKIVEYAASGLLLLVSDTSIHRQILGAEKCLYYIPLNAKAAFKSFVKLQVDQNLMNELRICSLKWVENFTYEKRVNRILQKIYNDE